MHISWLRFCYNDRTVDAHTCFGAPNKNDKGKLSAKSLPKDTVWQHSDEYMMMLTLFMYYVVSNSHYCQMLDIRQENL